MIGLGTDHVSSCWPMRSLDEQVFLFFKNQKRTKTISSQGTLPCPVIALWNPAAFRDCFRKSCHVPLLLYGTLPPSVIALGNPATPRDWFMEPCHLLWLLKGTMPPQVIALWNPTLFRDCFREPCHLPWLLYGTLPPTAIRETIRQRTNITHVSIPVMSRPGQSQGLLYKHRHNLLTHWVTHFLQLTLWSRGSWLVRVTASNHKIVYVTQV